MTRHHHPREERGIALVWTALLMTALLGAAAFAVDLGWIYLNNSRLQAAADSASLAGVVNLPGFPGQALADAQTAAAANGFAVGGTTSLTDSILADNEYEVTISASVPTFFMSVFGFDDVAIARSATAEYIKPVRLGSPDNQFGGPSQQFWAAINGRYTDRAQGDPFATECIENDSSSAGCSTFNPWYRAGGYYYAVEVEPGATGLQVELYDPGHYLRSSGSPGRSGSSDPSDTVWNWDWSDHGVNLEARLYAPDATPSDPTDNDTLVCSRTWGTYTGNTPSSGDQTAGGFNAWATVCTGSIASPTAGIYVLQLPPPDYEGSSKFAIRATTTSGAAPKVYGILDMSIHVNADGGNPQPYLAEVRPEHAGKTLEIDIFDFGESSTMDFEILDNTGAQATCSWSATNGESGSSPGPCWFDVGGGRFDHDWLYISIDIPDSYTCDPTLLTDCWWQVSIDNMSNPTDRTTWSARISGDPVRLIR